MTEMTKQPYLGSPPATGRGGRCTSLCLDRSTEHNSARKHGRLSTIIWSDLGLGGVNKDTGLCSLLPSGKLRGCRGVGRLGPERVRASA